ncbi:MAG TPA: hypothetical protein V6C88_11415 [Chroococcidiopsis sp.]
MHTTELDAIPVASLSDRYGVARSNIYNRLAGLNIEPEKQGGKAYLNADQLALMDRLDEHLKAGGTIADFQSGQIVSRPTGQAQKSYRTQDIAPTPTFGLTDLPEAIAMRVAAILQPPALPPTKPTDPLENLRRLNEICEQGWHLSTSQLAPLLGRKSLNGASFQRYGFTFTKVGRNGAESAWKVTKSGD